MSAGRYVYRVKWQRSNSLPEFSEVTTSLSQARVWAEYRAADEDEIVEIQRTVVRPPTEWEPVPEEPAA